MTTAPQPTKAGALGIKKDTARVSDSYFIPCLIKASDSSVSLYTDTKHSYVLYLRFNIT